ncbi:MAG: hypothetical protein KDA22_15495 [Phycisphaerales bacterium]|nr:hypothetical protein [Phycisphaerales bacterium]
MTTRCVDHVRAIAAAVVAAAAMAAGCETTVERPTNGRPLPPDPRPAPVVPEGVRPNAMAVMLVGPKPADTNGNGFPDLIVIDVLLFAEPYPTPLWSDGAFVFQVYPMGMSSNPDIQPLAQWRIEGPALLASRTQSLAGASYRFGLSLLESGTDVLPVPAIDLVSRFEPAADGPAIAAVGVRTIQLLPVNRR